MIYKIIGDLDGQHLPEKVRLFYTQITEWQGGDKSQHWRSPNISLPELLGPGGIPRLSEAPREVP